jgi:myo-inositol-1(or 4)-monophosphatase
VYDPNRNDLYMASKGRGAFLNDKRLRVAKRTRLSQCLIGTGFPYRPGDDPKRYLDMFAAVMQSCAGLRRPGSAALDLCYVAAGYTDGFFETGLSPWDIAAGSLLISEAGGLIGNFTGEGDYLEQREVLAGNPKIYAQLVTLLAPYSSVKKDPVAPALQSKYTPLTPELEPEPTATDAFLAAEVKPEPLPAPRPAPTRIRKEDMLRHNDRR